MNIIDGIFKRRKVNISKLLAYGFSENGDGFYFNTILPASSFQMSIVITREGLIKTTVIDTENDDIYTLHLSESATGSFVGEVRSEFEQILTDIAQKCFDIEVQCGVERITKNGMVRFL